MNIFLLVYTAFLFLIFIGIIFISFYKDKDEEIEENGSYNPKTLIIVPVKGLDLKRSERKYFIPKESKLFKL